MKKFLDQFALTPMQRIDMENFIFTQADKMLPGYGGGTWRTKLIGGVSILLLPVRDEKAAVTLENYAFGGSMTSDHVTASAAFSSIVTNWYMTLRAEQGRIRDENITAIADYASKLSRAAESLKGAAEFYRFID